MKTIEIKDYSIRRESAVDDLGFAGGSSQGLVEYNIEFETKDYSIEINQPSLGEDGLLLINGVEDCIFVSDGIAISNFIMSGDLLRIEGMCGSKPEIFDDKEKVLKELI